MDPQNQAVLDAFSANVKAVESNILNTQQLLREATRELNRREAIIDGYRRDAADHERMVTRLRELLRAEKFDDALAYVEREYDGIHGPRDSI